MSQPVKKSRCGFVVVKLRIAGDIYLLMRQDRRWKDVNFIGGHERAQDAGKLRRAARRELLEEVPSLRAAKSFELVPLTSKIVHGPINSRSAGCKVEYELQYFLVKFAIAPQPLLEALGPRSPNMLVRQEDLLVPRSYRVSGLVQVLDDELRGGLQSVPCSWPEDVGAGLRRTGQIELPLRWPDGSYTRS